MAPQFGCRTPVGRSRTVTDLSSTDARIPTAWLPLRFMIDAPVLYAPSGRGTIHPVDATVNQ